MDYAKKDGFQITSQPGSMGGSISSQLTCDWFLCLWHFLSVCTRPQVQQNSWCYLAATGHCLEHGVSMGSSHPAVTIQETQPWLCCWASPSDKGWRESEVVCSNTASVLCRMLNDWRRDTIMMLVHTLITNHSILALSTLPVLAKYCHSLWSLLFVRCSTA